jgi:CRP-like cAMP-binding protein
MSEHARQPTGNRILDVLPAEDFARLAPHLKKIDLDRGRVFHESGAAIEHAYFPTSGMVSLVNQMSSGMSVEIGLVGREGMAGLSVVLGAERSRHMAMQQIPGGAIRLPTELLRAEFKRGGALQELLLGYTQALLMQLGIVASCNRLHHMEERLARWLLMSADRTGSDELPLTHEFIAMMLGVRRAGVTEIALSLQNDRLIDYTRGHITIVDREGLEDLACECYRIIKTEFERLPA